MQAPHKSEYTYNHDLSALDLSLLIVFPAKRDIALVSAELYLFSLSDHFSVQESCIKMSPLAAPADRPYLLNIVCKLHEPLCAGEQIRGAVCLECDAGYREKSNESGKGCCAVYLG